MSDSLNKHGHLFNTHTLKLGDVNTWIPLVTKARRRIVCLMESRFVNPEMGDEVYDVSKWSPGAASVPILFFSPRIWCYIRDDNYIGPSKLQTERSGVSSEPVQIDCFNLFDSPVFCVLCVLETLGFLSQLSNRKTFLHARAFIHDNSIFWYECNVWTTIVFYIAHASLAMCNYDLQNPLRALTQLFRLFPPDGPTWRCARYSLPKTYPVLCATTAAIA